MKLDNKKEIMTNLDTNNEYSNKKIYKFKNDNNFENDFHFSFFFIIINNNELFRLIGIKLL